CQASCGGSPWFPVREVGPGNPILSDSTGEPPPSTFNYAWDIARNPRLKAILQKCDHSAIYLLIAGSYTPFTLVTLRGPWGWSLFGVSWGLAVFGIVQELTLGRRTRLLSMILYVAMGWLALVAVRPLIHALPPVGTAWLVAGGLIYSAGIYFFINDERIRHGHGIWHLFVLAGSLCQFVSVAMYVA
ncbi:PAQR family membrane homeostasis protein TrhA, partial [Burkholderia contaminans]|uniref:PAQR family membrane homeostasis protein TrhA n=1 Tax=Burkholderia contaminans TaxID=488447 RepID=UPI001CF420C8